MFVVFSNGIPVSKYEKQEEAADAKLVRKEGDTIVFYPEYHNLTDVLLG